MIYLTVMYIIAKFNLLDFGMSLFGALVLDLSLMWTIYVLSTDSRNQNGGISETNRNL